MFELLSDVHTVPVDKDSLATVYLGMNKVRVSVGDHVSEPSEVYILTGRSNGNLESYIIFYMLEPGIHVVYGWNQNPYAPEHKEQVIEVAVNFVEEMGSILEEVPWETMTSDQRTAWIEKEILFSPPVIEELEEIEEIQAEEMIQDVDETDDELEVDSALDLADDVVEVSEDEMRQALSENGNVEGLSASDEDDDEPMNENEADGVDDEDMEDVVVAEGDFDALLKQAFLKPDVAEKTRVKKGKKKAVKDEEKKPAPEEATEDEDVEVVVEGVAQAFEVDGGVEAEKEMKIPEEPEAVYQVESAPPGGDKAVKVVETPPGAGDIGLSERDTRVQVIRFLSRF
jgi:hypothetical protein